MAVYTLVSVYGIAVYYWRIGLGTLREGSAKNEK